MLIAEEDGALKNAKGNRDDSKEADGAVVVTAIIDSVGQFTDGFTITIKLCSSGKLYS